MRDVNRIPDILKRIEAVWTKHPDLRLGQLIENASPEYLHGIFYIEDEEFATVIEEFDERFSQ